MEAENDSNGTRGGMGAAPEHETSNSELVSDNEDIREESHLLRNKLDGSLGGTPLDRENLAEDAREGDESQQREAMSGLCAIPGDMIAFVREIYTKYDPTFVTMLCA